MAKRRGHNEGSIYRRDDGLWVGAVTIGRDAAGRNRRRVVYGKTRRDAAEKLTKLLTDAQQGIPVDPSRQSLGDFLVRWLDDAVTGTVRPNTMESYKYTLKHILPSIGHLQLSKLTPQHLVKLYRQKQDAGLTRTVVLIHALLHKALGQATKWGPGPP